MKKHITQGFAIGLSSHSSMKNSSEMFKKSEIFEISSISKDLDHESSLKENGEFKMLQLNCRFCGRGCEKEPLSKVCRCPNKYSGHKSCVKGQAEGKCKKCGTKWLKEDPVFKLTPDILNPESVNKLSSRSILNESSGELRMKNIIKSSTQSPICRICKVQDQDIEKIIYPCQCHTINPNLAWAHRDCIFSQILSLQKDDCDRCKARFSFLPIYKSTWVCSDPDHFNAYLTTISLLILFLLSIIGIIIFLDRLEEIHSISASIYIWSLVLIIVFSILLLALSVLFLKTLITRSRLFSIVSLEVLCQKQEIAKMSSQSHIFFSKFLSDLRKKNLISALPVIKKEPNNGQNKQDSLSIRPPRTIIDMDTNGENLDSEMLREHSSVKLVSFQLNNSEDFKEEEIQEFSDMNS